MRKIVASSLLAIAVQPLVLLAWSALPALLHGESDTAIQVLRISPLASLFSIPFVVLVGIPSVILLRRRGPLRWTSLACIGFIAAALWPALSLPGGDPGTSYGGGFYGVYAQFVVNGEPTIYGWLDYFASVLTFGVHGLVGASMFYLIGREPQPLSRQ